MNEKTIIKGSDLKGKVMGFLATADFREAANLEVDGNKIRTKNGIGIPVFEIKNIYKFLGERFDVLVLVDAADEADVKEYGFNIEKVHVSEIIVKEVLSFNDLSTWKFLVENGVYKMYINDYAICYGLINGKLDIVNYFEKNTNMKPYLSGAIRQAARHGYFDIMQYFNVSLGADISENLDHLMYESTIGGHVETLRYLYEHQTEKPGPEKLGKLLRTAARYGYLDLIMYLHSIGADIKENSNAIIEAASENHLDVIKYLFENGADIRVNSDRAFNIALQEGYTDVAAFLFDNGCEYDRLNWSNRIHADIPEWLYFKICNSRRHSL